MSYLKECHVLWSPDFSSVGTKNLPPRWEGDFETHPLPFPPRKDRRKSRTTEVRKGPNTDLKRGRDGGRSAPRSVPDGGPRDVGEEKNIPVVVSDLNPWGDLGHTMVKL